MKTLVAVFILTCLCVGSARADLIGPGGPGGDSPGGQLYTIYDDSLDGFGPGTYQNGYLEIIQIRLGDPNDENNLMYRHYLDQPVVAGDVVLGENTVPTSDPATWSDVVRFSSGSNGLGIADMYSWDSFASAGITLSQNAVFIPEYLVAHAEDPGYQGGYYTVYVDEAGDKQPNTYLIESVAVPEPATCLAGVLLLLPFGISTLRIMRRNRA